MTKNKHATDSTVLIGLPRMSDSIALTENGRLHYLLQPCENEVTAPILPMGLPLKTEPRFDSQLEAIFDLSSKP